MNTPQMDKLTKFANMLTKVEAEIQKSNFFTDYECSFVADMREKFDGRDAQLDLGTTAWIPSLKQYNFLHGLWSVL